MNRPLTEPWTDCTPDDAAALLRLQADLRERGDEILEVSGRPWSEVAPAIQKLAHGETMTCPEG